MCTEANFVARFTTNSEHQTNLPLFTEPTPQCTPDRPGDIVLFSQWLLHGSFDGNNPLGRARLSTDLRWHATDDGGFDERYQGEQPLGTGGGGYAELNGARPLNEGWHKR